MPLVPLAFGLVISGPFCSPSAAGHEVNRPRHGAAETLTISPLKFECDRLRIIVANPLVVPSDLLHHGLLEQLWGELPLFDNLFNLAEGPDCISVLESRLWR